MFNLKNMLATALLCSSVGAQALNAVYGEYTVVANTYLDSELYNLETDGEWIALKVVFHETKDDLNKDVETRARAWSKSTVLSDGVSLMKASGRRHCILHIVRPTDWNDKQVMVDAGHEIMHCLGADH